MPTETHELFIDAVEDDIRSQLKEIRNGSGRLAEFAQRVRPGRSTEVRFDTSASSGKSKYEPDASFWHQGAEYPGVIVEVAYSQKKRRLDRLAENYLLDSDANIRVVVGLDIMYGKESRKASLSLWRPQEVDTPEGTELQAVDVVGDKVVSVLVHMACSPHLTSQPGFPRRRRKPRRSSWHRAPPERLRLQRTCTTRTRT
jgi:hypothetical protein